ncbi:hypothetical protein AT746_12825 [Lacimicrobium alkaliphilum]|uniref:Sulfotransferase domain-containing protein n=2 Tax=Lacimicrobium alkaliphilum TaxID=1526571 RepID=A0A0U2Z811_9ALTE|nr:hypothetical protein AT746_12825 [Lacimicrobium alkaliphilum]
MKRKSFLLCVGSQKSGTTWLHKQLSMHNEVNFGYAKEYHYFDYLYLDSHKKKLGGLLSKNKKYSDNDKNWHPEFFIRKDYYFEYFIKLLESRKETTLTGDFTPEYALLSLDNWREVFNAFSKLDLNIKVLFIMRDPLERIWSACRMHRKLKPELFCLNDEVISDDQYINLNYNRKDIEERTRYEKTISTLDAALEKSQMMYALYEELHTEQFRKDLGKFLELENVSLDTKKRYNNQEKVQTISEKHQGQ